MSCLSAAFAAIPSVAGQFKFDPAESLSARMHPQPRIRCLVISLVPICRYLGTLVTKIRSENRKLKKTANV